MWVYRFRKYTWVFSAASSTDAAKDGRKGKKASMAKVDKKGPGGVVDQDVRLL